MKKALVLAAVAVTAVIASALPALAADGPAKTFSQDVTLGFYRGQVVAQVLESACTDSGAREDP